MARSRHKHFDWELIRDSYVSGDDSVTLRNLSKRPNAPCLRAVKERCTNEGWVALRKRHRSVEKVPGTWN